MKRSFLFLILVFTAQCFANPIPSSTALSIVEPTTITVPGNYRLANDISGTLTIAADDVCLNLENRKISGGVNNIEVTGHSNVSIKNGVIEGATRGILIDTCTDIEIHNVDFIDNGTGLLIITTTCVTVDESTFGEGVFVF